MANTIYRLKEARKMRGLTLREASVGLKSVGIDITFQYLEKIEKEGCRMDSEKLIKYASFYKVSIDYLILDPNRPKIELSNIRFFKASKY